MLVARSGCQLAALFCSASAATSGSSASGGCIDNSTWISARLCGDILAAALQLVHLPIGFQVLPLP